MNRLKFWKEKGLLKKKLEELLTKYKRADFLEAPKMNAPIESRMSLPAKKRDEHKRQIQNAIASALMAVASVTSTLITETESVDPVQLVENLIDAIQILADVYHKQTVARRTMVTPGFNKTVKEILEKPKPDEYLFGNDLVFKLKQAKAIEKLTADAKQQSTSSGTQSTKNYNSRPGFRFGSGPTNPRPYSRPRLYFKKPSTTQKQQFPRSETHNKFPHQKKKQ